MNEDTFAVVISCDRNQYWLLPWWLYHVRQVEPVLDIIFVAQEALPAEVSDLLECRSCDILSIADLVADAKWDRAWYVKPHAMQAALRSVDRGNHVADWLMWMDLDCQVIRPLNLQQLELTYTALTVRADAPAQQFWSKHLLAGETVLNSGVFLLPTGTPAIQDNLLDPWIHWSRWAQHRFAGDQDVLSRIVYHTGLVCNELPQPWNLLRWELTSLQDPEPTLRASRVIHWTGPAGKAGIIDNIKTLQAQGVSI